MWREELLKLRGQRLMLIGIGNLLRRDDGIGVRVAEELKQVLAKEISDGKLIVHMAGITPEDCLPLVLMEKPEAVLMLDACDCGLPSGEIVLLEGKLLPERFNSTHAIPPKIIGGVIEKYAGSKVYYLGIQIKAAGMGEEISSEVQEAGREVVEYFKNWLERD